MLASSIQPSLKLNEWQLDTGRPARAIFICSSPPQIHARSFKTFFGDLNFDLKNLSFESIKDPIPVHDPCALFIPPKGCFSQRRLFAFSTNRSSSHSLPAFRPPKITSLSSTVTMQWPKRLLSVQLYLLSPSWHSGLPLLSVVTCLLFSASYTDSIGLSRLKYFALSSFFYF